MAIYDWDHIKKHHPGAKYAAMDNNGKVYSYEYLPTFRRGFWEGIEGVDYVVGPYTGAVFADERPLSAEESLERYGNTKSKGEAIIVVAYDGSPYKNIILEPVILAPYEFESFDEIIAKYRLTYEEGKGLSVEEL